MEEDLDGITFNIRACIVSSKGPIFVRNLNRDYETLTGGAIPYRNFGYSSLESFLQSLPSLRVCGSGRDAMVEAAASSASKHVSNLIAKQKTTSKRNIPPPRRGHGPSIRGSSRGRARGYAPAKYYAPRETEPPRKYSYPSYHKNENYENNTPLVVKVDSSDKRQVSLGETPNKKHSFPKTFEVPPRLRKLQQNIDESYVSPPLPSPSVADVPQTFEDLSFDQLSATESDIPDSRSIISPLGPSQLIAAGRSLLQQQEQEQVEALARFEEMYLTDPLQNGVPSSVPVTYPVNESIIAPVVYEDNIAPVTTPTIKNSTVLDSVVPTPDEIIISNNINLLLKYCLDMAWTVPEYKTISRRPKGSRAVYSASVKLCGIGNNVKKYNGYPFEDENVQVAKGYAAKKALEELLKEEKVKQLKTIISSDHSLICSRISDMVSGVHSGKFAHCIEEEYLKNYMESLPEDWIQILNGCRTVMVEDTLNSTIIFPKDDTVQAPVFSQSAPAPEALSLELLQDQELSVFITHASSTTDIWFQIIDDNYSGKYEELLEKMEEYYTAKGSFEMALSIEKDQYYAAKSLHGWHRVCVLEVKQETKMVTALLIDHGDNDFFAFSSLYNLPAEFSALPRQAIQCALEGLESFSEDSTASEVIGTSEDLIGKSLVAIVQVKEKDLIKVTLFDTSGSDDVNVNEKIRDDIIYAKADPVLPCEGRIMEVFISHISKRGEIYIQIPGPVYERISEVLESLGEEEICKHKLTSYRQVVLNKMYLAKFHKDENWYRAIVTTTPSVQQNKIAVRFVDFGNSETVSITDIVDLERLPLVLSKLPPQAIKVALHNLPLLSLTNTEVARIHSLLLDEEDKVVLIKTIQLQEDPPLVEIFFKNDDKGVVSVNSTIELHRLQFKTEDKKSLELRNYSLNLTPSNGNATLRQPELNEDKLDVLVYLVANPSNFIFQPYKYCTGSDSLMKQMLAYYNAASLPEITKDEVNKGCVYVAQLEDLNWYRVIVTGEIMGSKVPVRLCDFGDVMYVNISNLREIESDFLQEPFMAVRGKLSGVEPLHTDWAVEDCIRFHNLVLGKKLEAYVMGIEDNFLSPMEMVVNLCLVDTSTQGSGLPIADILIKENRAKAV